MKSNAWLLFAIATVWGASVQGQDTINIQQSRPHLSNAPEVRDSLTSSYPDLLRALEISGMSVVRMFVTTEGIPDSMYVATTSGSRALDDAALQVAKAMKFTPARMGDNAIGTWIEVPLRFAPYASNHNERDPELSNFSATRDTLRAHYASVVKDIGDDLFMVEMSLTLDSVGMPVGYKKVHSSCILKIDEAARTTAQGMRFSSGQTTNLTMYFGPDSAYFRVSGDNLPRPMAMSMAEKLGAGWLVGAALTPDIKKPELLNRSQVARALQRAYPPGLRDRGIGGTILVVMMVDEQGAVIHKTVKGSSGTCGLDLAALAVARIFRFSPALKNGSPVRVWIAMPIVFKTIAWH